MKARNFLLVIGSVVCLICLSILQRANAQNSEIQDEAATKETIISGKMLFSGSTNFTSGGPSCITCHNVTHNDLISGGLLAKDLTNVYTRMGDAGLSGIIGSPPFPAMASAYRNNKLTEEEISELTAFFKHSDDVSFDQKVKSGNEIFFVYGPMGLILWLILIYFIWFNRKKESVKKEVYDRQIKPIN